MSRVPFVSPTVTSTEETQRKIAVSVNQVIEKLQPFGVKSASSTITVTEQFGFYSCDASASAMTVFLPEAGAYKGAQFSIKKIDASANVVLVDGNASETIDGTITTALSSQYAGVTVISTGSAWLKVT